MKKLNICIVFGGRSPEHDVSITSAASILKEIDKKRFNPIALYIAPDGNAKKIDDYHQLSDLAGHFLKRHIMEKIDCTPAMLPSWPLGSLMIKSDCLSEKTINNSHYPISDNKNMSSFVKDQEIHALFPIIHGFGGEDGSIQGLCRLADIPCIGSDILGSSAGLDKITMKMLFDYVKLPLLPWFYFSLWDWNNNSEKIYKNCENLGFPVFIKPANAGSSLGITKVYEKKELEKGIVNALNYDCRIMVEKGIKPREIECAILGNDKLFASIAGEVISHRDYYDYQAKYLEDGSKLEIPAKISQNQLECIQKMSKEAFKAVSASGLSRVDFLINKENDEIFVNEINTMPGFTPISMYPQLMEFSGIPYKELISKLIDLAIGCFQTRKIPV